MATSPRLARFGLGQNPAPERWVSELAEELAGKLEEGLDPGSLSLRIRAAAAEHKISDLWLVANLVAREWDRLGIRRIPMIFEAGGW
jgi:hypothetical protein